MADELERIELATARKNLSTLVTRAADGESFVITRYGKDTAIISGNFTVSGMPTQMEHGAAAPTHRPAAEPLVVKGSAYADRHPRQAATDAILGAARVRPKR
jgi:prevent-host-death family protein